MVNVKAEVRWLVIIAVVAFGVFAQTLGGSFVYDDNRQIVRNPLIQKPALYGKALTSDVWAFKGDGTLVASNYWRPTFTAWCIANYAAFGVSPFGWHLLNVLLNVIACLLAYLLLRRWAIGEVVSFCIAVIFAVHPVHSESVAWISGSPDLLFAAAFFGSLWFAADRMEGKRPNLSLALSLLLYAVALGSKEVAFFCFPIYFLMFLRSDGDGSSVTTDRNSLVYALKGSGGFAVVATAYFISRFAVLGGISQPVENAPGSQAGWLSIPTVFVFYLKQLVFPVTMGENYPLRPVESLELGSIIFPTLIAVAVLITIWFIIRRDKTARIGAALFLLPLAPVLYVASFPSDQIVHDRYLYVPLLGFLMIAYAGLRNAATWAGAVNLQKYAIAGACLLIAVLGFKTVQYNRVWENDLTLWAHNVEIDPSSAASFSQYGSELSSRGRYAEALAAFERSIEIRPGALGYMGRARALISLARYDEAAADLAKVIGMSNSDINAYTLYQSYESYALAFQMKQDLGKAEAVLREGRERLPIYSAAMTEKLAIILYLQDRKAEALKELEAAKGQARRELLPESKSVFLRLAMLYSELGRKDEARAALNEYLQLTAGANDSVSAEGRKAASGMLNRMK